MKKSKLKIKKIEKCDLDLGLSLDTGDSTSEKSEALQRTEEWHLDRLGRWTGSQQKNLMSCSSKGGKMTWNDFDKIFHFGTGALKYIYENGMERKSGKYVDMGAGTKEMQYGTRVEPLIGKAAKRKLQKMEVYGKMKDVGFKQFPTMPNAGVSSDSILVDEQGKALASVEMKACTAWSTHFERTFEATDEASKDFWQTQGQMIAWDVDCCYYVVAEPPITINKYLYHDGGIMDLYKEFKKECSITIEVIKASKMHQDALLKRICIAENTLREWLKNGGNLKEVLYDKIDFYKENPELLNEYIK